MAKVIVTLRIMPDSPEADLDALEAAVKEKIAEFCGETETRTELKPIAFGLKAVQIMFVAEESKGTTDPLEQSIAQIDHVQSIEVTEVRRAIG